MKSTINILVLCVLTSFIANSSFATDETYAQISQSIKYQLQNSNTKIKRVLPYCSKFKTWDNKDDFKCRVLVMTAGTDSSVIASFYESFSSTAREIGATTYFMTNSASPNYTAYFDSFYDQNEHEIDLLYPENKNVQLEIKDDGLPKISNLVLGKWKMEGASGYALVTIIYTVDKVVVSGLQFETDEISGKTSESPFSETYLALP